MASSNTYLVKDVKGVPNGLPIQFEEELDERFLCCTCSSLTPMGLKDGKGHLFCLACTRAHTDSENQFTCSQCGWQSLTNNMTTNTQDWSSLEEELAFCPNMDEACSFQGAFRDVLLHYNLCGLKRKVQCSLCGSLHPRKKLGDHMKEDCPKRVLDCVFCGEDMEADQKEKHEEDCRYRPGQCPYCDKSFDTFAQLEDEHYPDCGSMPISCSFKPLGCDVLQSRDAMDKHDHDVHRDIIVKEICGLKETNKELQEGMQDIKTSLSELENKANVSSDHRTELEKSLTELKEHIETLAQEIKDLGERLDELE